MKWLAAAALALVVGACAGNVPAPRNPTRAEESVGVARPTARNLGGTAPPGSLDPRPGRPELVSGEAAACVPGCGVGRVAGGRLPEGRYQTRWFFGGFMTVETDGTWSLTEDSNAELSLPIRDDYRVAFALDPVLVLHGDTQPHVRLDAAAYAAWLARHEDLDVAGPRDDRLGSVQAISVDVRLAPGAGQDEAGCGSEPCITFIMNPAIPAGYRHVDGILGDDVYRFIFADISYAGTDHLLVVKIEGRDATDLRASVARVEDLLANVRIPASPR